MDRVASLQGQVVGLDTAPVIYFIEEHPTYLPMVLPFFAALNRGESQVVTSIVTLLEVLVQLFQRGDTAVRRLCVARGLAASSAIGRETRIVVKLGVLSGRLRYCPIRLNAIQLATAIIAGAVAFLTDDARLPRLPALRLLVLDELP